MRKWNLPPWDAGWPGVGYIGFGCGPLYWEIFMAKNTGASDFGTS